MVLVLDASAMLALLLLRPEASVVAAALSDGEATVYAHAANACEVFYQVHRRGALAKWLSQNPHAQNPTQPDKPNLEAVNFFDASVFDSGAGDVAAAQALGTLEAVGVQIVGAMDAALWQDVARLKSQFRRVALPDCYGVALARRLDAHFVTGDRGELEALEAAGTCDFLWIK